MFGGGSTFGEENIASDPTAAPSSGQAVDGGSMFCCLITMMVRNGTGIQ